MDHSIGSLFFGGLLGSTMDHKDTRKNQSFCTQRCKKKPYGALIFKVIFKTRMKYVKFQFSQLNSNVKIWDFNLAS